MGILMLLVYISGVFFMHGATAERIRLISIEGDEKQQKDLEMWWGGLFRSMLSLYESILGGVDWDGIVKPLGHISAVWPAVFMVYIVFAALCIMNVITGIFVQSALNDADRQKDQNFRVHATSALDAIGGESKICHDDYVLLVQDQHFRRHMQALGIEASEAMSLFYFLDDGSSLIDKETLLAGLIRLRAGARFIDVLTLLNNIDCLKSEELGRDVRPKSKPHPYSPGKSKDKRATPLVPEAEVPSIVAGSSSSTTTTTTLII